MKRKGRYIYVRTKWASEKKYCVYIKIINLDVVIIDQVTQMCLYKDEWKIS